MGRFRVCVQTRTPLRAKNQKQEGEINVKKIISIALALLMVAVMLPVMAMAEGTNVAKIGDTEYATLEEAFTAVTTTNATTITLLNDADVKNKIIISDGKNITLDLGGHNVTISTLGMFFYVNNATFTVNGSGSIKEVAVRALTRFE